MSFFDCDKSIVENLYLLSGPIIAVFGIFAAFSYWLTKNLSNRDFERRRMEYTFTLIDRYKEVMRLFDSFMEKTHHQKPNIKTIDVNFKITLIEKQLGKEEFLKIRKEKMSNSKLWLEIINELEYIGLAINNELVSEEIISNFIGQDFIKTIDDLYFEISVASGKDNSLYNNIIIVYNLWKKRFKTS